MLAPLIACGCEAAHRVLDVLISPGAGAGHELFESSESGSGYVPLLFAVGVALIIVVLGSYLFGPARRGQIRPPAWAFAALPLAGFALQELLESFLAHGHLSWSVLLCREFVIGLALQLPFAAAAFLFARALCRVARALGCLDGNRRPGVLLAWSATGWVSVENERRSRWWLSGGAEPTRGPPLLAAR